MGVIANPLTADVVLLYGDTLEQTVKSCEGPWAQIAEGGWGQGISWVPVPHVAQNSQESNHAQAS